MCMCVCVCVSQFLDVGPRSLNMGSLTKIGTSINHMHKLYTSLIAYDVYFVVLKMK